MAVETQMDDERFIPAIFKVRQRYGFPQCAFLIFFVSDGVFFWPLQEVKLPASIPGKWAYDLEVAQLEGWMWPG